jgi:hypothetical protein
MTKKRKKHTLPDIKPVNKLVPAKPRKNRLVIAGHKMSPKDWEIFQHFHTHKSGMETCKHFGFSAPYLSKLKRTEWWQELELDTVLLWQSQFMHRFMGLEGKIIEAVEGVLEGDQDRKQTSNAIAKILELYLKQSPMNIEPLLVNKQDVSVKVKKSVNVNVSIDKDKVRALTPLEVSEWAMTGTLPALMNELETEEEDIYEYTIEHGQGSSESLDGDGTTDEPPDSSDY